MKNKTIILPLLLLYQLCLGQGHGLNWIFGSNTEPPHTFTNGNLLNFDSNELKISSIDLALKINVTGLVMSDEGGELIFYSNGIKLHDVDDNLMPNGDSLNEGWYASLYNDVGYNVYQSMITLPFEEEGLYHIIHRRSDTIFVGIFPIIPDVLLTTVDMGLNNGKGSVTEKNQLVFSSLYTGFPSATRHANGRDWWVIVPERTDSLYWRILVAPSGVGLVDSQFIETGVLIDTVFSNLGGQIFFTQDGQKYIEMDNKSGTKVFDFDRCNGHLSNARLLPPLPANIYNNYGMAISPNSRYLYACNATTIYQYDLWSADIGASIETVAEWDGSTDAPGAVSVFSSMHLAPDGKIYIIAGHPSNKTLHVINYPDKKGDACDVRQKHVQMPHSRGSAIMLFPNYRLGPLDGSACDTLGLDNHPLAGFRCEPLPSEVLAVEFTDNSFYEPAQWSWDFGDGVSSQDTSPVHVFPGPGNYTVCLTVSNNNGSDEWCKVVNVTVSGTDGQGAGSPKIAVTPNPAHDGTYVHLSGDYLPRHAELRLFTATGQLVRAERILYGWNTVGLEGIAPGIYFYEVRDASLPGQGERLLSSGKLVRVE